MKNTIRPLRDFVIIDIERPKEKSGKIVIPDTSSLSSNIGTIVACGEGRISPEGNVIPMRVKQGDKVIFNTFATNYYNKVKVDEEDVFMFKEEDIIAVIN